MKTSRDVVIYKIRTVRGATKRPYNLRWRVGKGSKPFSEYFGSEDAAKGREGEFRYWLGKGAEFDCETGLPLPLLAEEEEKRRQEADARQAESTASLFKEARAHATAMWEHSSGNYRASIADTMRDLLTALLPERPPWIDARSLSLALRNYAFNPSEDLATLKDDDPESHEVVIWAEEHSPGVEVMADLETVRRVLHEFTQCWADRQYRERRRAGAKHFEKRRAIFSGFIKHLLVNGLLADNPLSNPLLGWKRPTDLQTVDKVSPREVGNRKQVEAMLAAVSYTGLHGQRYLAFFGLMYYAMLRPEEAVILGRDQCELPRKAGKWGQLILEESSSWAGKRWTTEGTPSERRPLKHRGKGDTRPVPLPPRGVELLRAHLKLFPPGADGLLFTTPSGRKPTHGTLARIWQDARQIGQGPTERGGLLLHRPYSLRHSGISMRLYAGVPPVQVAEWAGHTVSELQETYAKVIQGYERRWEQQIDNFLDDSE